ncbi:hypothetical protein Q9233_008805 [Columba guinea]|nr:hypothetical protein Q9233_008805 [Columba guinea]
MDMHPANAWHRMARSSGTQESSWAVTLEEKGNRPRRIDSLKMLFDIKLCQDIFILGIAVLVSDLIAISPGGSSGRRAACQHGGLDLIFCKHQLRGVVKAHSSQVAMSCESQVIVKPEYPDQAEFKHLELSKGFAGFIASCNGGPLCVLLRAASMVAFAPAKCLGSLWGARAMLRCLTHDDGIEQLLTWQDPNNKLKDRQTIGLVPQGDSGVPVASFAHEEAMAA